MEEKWVSKSDGESVQFLIHFNVDDHYLNITTFIETARSAETVFEAFQREIFGNNLKFELVVLAPEEGTFLQKLGVRWVVPTLTALAAAVVFLDSDTPAAFIEGVTGKPPSEWARELGEAVSDIGTDNPIDVHDEDLAPSVEASCRISANLLVSLTRGFLEKEDFELKKLVREREDLFDALEARAEFYAACIEDVEIAGVGFTSEDHFPIPRSAFVARAEKPVRKKQDDEPPEWLVSIDNVYVNAPNWDEEDQHNRKWKGKDSNGRACYFVIEDAQFWQLSKKKTLHVEGIDNFKVQWAIRFLDNKVKERRVLRVLELNNRTLAAPLDSNAISAILGKHSTGTREWEGLSLFDYWDEE